MAHAPKSYHLGFGNTLITSSNLAKANANRHFNIFEEFAYKMISIAQRKHITKEFEIAGRFYAFDPHYSSLPESFLVGEFSQDKSRY